MSVKTEDNFLNRDETICIDLTRAKVKQYFIDGRLNDLAVAADVELGVLSDWLIFKRNVPAEDHMERIRHALAVDHYLAEAAKLSLERDDAGVDPYNTHRWRAAK